MHNVYPSAYFNNSGKSISQYKLHVNGKPLGKSLLNLLENKDDLKTSSNLLYWIIGIVLLLVIIGVVCWCVASKNKEGNPEDKDDTFYDQDNSETKEPENDKLDYSAI